MSTESSKSVRQSVFLLCSCVGDRIVFTLSHSLLFSRYAADGFHAEEHPSYNRSGVH